jgi:hypothetical protein
LLIPFHNYSNSIDKTNHPGNLLESPGKLTLNTPKKKINEKVGNQAASNAVTREAGRVLPHVRVAPGMVKMGASGGPREGGMALNPVYPLRTPAWWRQPS